MVTTTWPWPGSTIMRAVDGDTIVAQLSKDIGFHGVVTFQQRLRLNRINTEPVHTTAGEAARAFVASRVGCSVDITTIKPYKFGDEWMAEVVLGGGANLSDLLVATGLAVPWDGKGPRPGG